MRILRRVGARLRDVHWRTVPLRVLVALVGVYVTYFVVINLFIVSGAFKATLNHVSPSHAHFEWSSAYSPWFFRVHAKNFVLRGEDSSVEWLMTFNQAKVTFGMTDFLSHRVHMKNATAHGVSIRIRFKLEPAAATPDYLAKLPPMDGLTEPPLVPAIPPPPITDANYPLWTVQLEDVVADDVYEVWVNDVRVLEPRGRVQGGFYLKPLRRIGVYPSRVELSDAEVTIGKDTLASSVEGTFGVHVAELDVREPKGSEFLRYMEARANMRARLGDLKALTALMNDPHVSMYGGAGAIQMNAELDRGVIVRGSNLRMRSDDWHFVTSRDSAAASSFVEAYVSDAPLLHVFAESHDYVMHRDRAETVRVPALGVALRALALDVTRPLDRWNASIDAPSGRVPDLTALNGYVGSAFFPHGSAGLKLHTDFSEHTAMLRLDLRDVSVGKTTGWWATFTANPLAVSFSAPSVSGVVTGKLKDASVPLDVLDAPGIARAAFGGQSFTYKTNIRVSSTQSGLSDLHMVGDSIEVRAHYQTANHTSNGAAIIELPIVNVGVEIRDGKSSVHPLVGKDWYDHALHAPRATR